MRSLTRPARFAPRSPTAPLDDEPTSTNDGQTGQIPATAEIARRRPHTNPLALGVAFFNFAIILLAFEEVPTFGRVVGWLFLLLSVGLIPVVFHPRWAAALDRWPWHVLVSSMLGVYIATFMLNLRGTVMDKGFLTWVLTGTGFAWALVILMSYLSHMNQRLALLLPTFLAIAGIVFLSQERMFIGTSSLVIAIILVIAHFRGRRVEFTAD